MSSSPAGGSRVRVLGLLFGVVALVSAFVLVSLASGAADPLKGGTVQLSLKQKGLKFSSKKPKLTISGGNVDPTTMVGTATVAGKSTVKKGKKKTKLQFTALNLTGNGAGSLDAKVGSKTVAKCLTFTKGTLGRNGFDGLLANAKLALGKKCAKQLAKKLGGAGASASAASGPKKGAVGTVVAIDTVPSTVTVTGGTATLTFDSKALARLSSKGVLPNGSGPAQPCTEPSATSARCHIGVNPIAPATENQATATFTFPVVAGKIAPDGSSGQIQVGGGIDLKKVNSSCNAGTGGLIEAGGGTACTVTGGRMSKADLGGTGTACNDNQSELAISDLVFDAASKTVSANVVVTVPIAPSNNQSLNNAPLSNITTFTSTSNPAAKTVTADAALVNTLSGAGVENKVLGDATTAPASGGPCGDSTNDFAPNSGNGVADAIGPAVLNLNTQ